MSIVPHGGMAIGHIHRLPFSHWRRGLVVRRVLVLWHVLIRRRVSVVVTGMWMIHIVAPLAFPQVIHITFALVNHQNDV